MIYSCEFKHALKRGTEMSSRYKGDATGRKRINFGRDFCGRTDCSMCFADVANTEAKLERLKRKARQTPASADIEALFETDRNTGYSEQVSAREEYELREAYLRMKREVKRPVEFQDLVYKLPPVPEALMIPKQSNTIVREPMTMIFDEIKAPKEELIITPKAPRIPRARTVVKGAGTDDVIREERPAQDGAEQRAQAQQQLAMRAAALGVPDSIVRSAPIAEIEEEEVPQRHGSLMDELLAANEHHEVAAVAASQPNKKARGR